MMLHDIQHTSPLGHNDTTRIEVENGNEAMEKLLENYHYSNCTFSLEDLHL